MSDLEAQNGTLCAGSFIRLSTERLLDVVQLAQDKHIQGRDIVVLMLALHFCNWKTGKARFTAKRMSEILGTAQNNVRASLKRLRLCSLLVQAEERDGTPYYIPHPRIFVCGNGRPRGLLLKAYSDAVYGKNNKLSTEDLEDEFTEEEFEQEPF